MANCKNEFKTIFKPLKLTAEQAANEIINNY